MYFSITFAKYKLFLNITITGAFHSNAIQLCMNFIYSAMYIIINIEIAIHFIYIFAFKIFVKFKEYFLKF